MSEARAYAGATLESVGYWIQTALWVLSSTFGIPDRGRKLKDFLVNHLFAVEIHLTKPA